MPPFLTQRKQILVKIETVEGTDAAPGDPDVVTEVFEPEYAPDFTQFERNNVQPSFSRLPQVQGERFATMNFQTELKGSGVAGTAPPNLSAPLQGCSMSETIVASTSVTYAPVSEASKSVTVEMRTIDTDGVAKIQKIIGARGNITLEATKGQPVLAVFEFTGKYVEPTEGSAATAPTPGTFPKNFLNAGISFQGVGTLKISAVTVSLGNQMNLRNDANDATGNLSSVITDRSPTGSIDPEMVLIATLNTYNKLTSASEGILTYVLGSIAGNITTINAPKAQIINISPADREGIEIETLDLQLNQDAAAGDDELTIAFT